MKLKIKYHDILTRTGRAILFLISEREVWLPSRAVTFCNGMYFSIDEKLAIQKELHGKPFLHVPEQINPIFNQEVLDDLKYQAGSGL